MAPLYKKALIVGATSGIGEALAIKLAETGTEVIAVGRRRDRLDALVGKAPKGTISTQTLDITDLAAIPGFAASLTAAHADLDAIILNSGVQRAFDFGTPASVDLDVFELELKTNYTSYAYLVKAFLPHLQAAVSAGSPAHLVFISATLGLVPSLVRTPNYNASKAALHAFITAVRQQQIDAGYEKLRIVEVFPPAVQTELHDTVHQPDLVGGDKLGMPLDAFTNELVAKLSADPTLFIGIGPAEALIAEGGLEDQRQKLFETQQVAIKGALSQYIKKVRRTRQTTDEHGRPVSRVMGPQSALTDFLASRNISAAQIEQNFRARTEAAERLLREEQEANGERPSTPGAAGSANAEEAATATPQLSSAQKRTLDKIKAEKKKKKSNKKRKVFGSDEDEEEDDLASAIFRAAAATMPIAGQMDNCGKCGKRFTVTPYSRADSSGKLLCTACGKLLDKEDENKKKKEKEKEKEKNKLKARGGRRKAASHLLDGGSIVGPKPLVALCVEHLSRNIALADDLGDLPSDVVDRIARMLSKRRLVDHKTIELFIRAAADEICTYDCAKMSEGDFLRMLQEMPRLKLLRLYNAVQFKDDVMHYLMLRDIQLETLMLYGANLLSEAKWKEYLVSRGRSLRQLHICYTDKHITDEVMSYIKECAPQLERLKIRGNQEVTGEGVEHISQLKHLKHIGLGLQKPVHSDSYVKLFVRAGAGLQTFSVRNASGVDNATLAAMHQSCRSLRKLRMTENQLCTDEGFERLFEGWENPPLHFVDLEKCRYDNADFTTVDMNTDGIGLCSKGFKALMAHSGLELRELCIISCRHIEKEAFEEVFAEGKTYPELRRIDVSFCGEVTDEILYSMFRCCPNLYEIVTFGCMLVTGRRVPHGRVVVGVPNAIGMQTVGRAE